jgi:hypothetical protein
VSELLSIINQREQKPDPSITVDFFSVPKTPDDPEATRARGASAKRKAAKETHSPPIPPLPRTPRRFRIEKIRGGFAIRNGDAGARPPRYIGVHAAYDVRRGDPLRKYHEADFDLGKPPIQCSAGTHGVEVRNASRNQMEVEIKSQEFMLEVVGFDANRDIYLRVLAKEADNADQAN